MSAIPLPPTGDMGDEIKRIKESMTEESSITAPPPFAPAMGRQVHYVSYGTPGGEYKSVCRTATITEVVGPMDVNLCVMNPTGLFFNHNVEHTGTSEKTGGTWHYYTECQRQY